MRRLIHHTAVALVALLLCPPMAQAEEKDGYYYPPVTSEENFSRDLVADAPPSDAELRERFVTMVTRAQLDAPETPRFAIFAKGGDSQRLIMVALDDSVFRSLFRARAVLAQLSSNLRSSPLFAERGLDTTATFFDMLRILDFDSLTISDGVEWSHRIHFR